jgi:hypothetical protein
VGPTRRVGDLAAKGPSARCGRPGGLAKMTQTSLGVGDDDPTIIEPINGR